MCGSECPTCSGKCSGGHRDDMPCRHEQVFTKLRYTPEGYLTIRVIHEWAVAEQDTAKRMA